MKHIPLHIPIDEKHPAYQWARKQSDKVNAMGHIGTHIDCYSKVPACDTYELDVAVFDCRKAMPTAKDFESQPVQGKVVVLFTNILNTLGYGGDEYGKAKTFLTRDALDTLLRNHPAFILIDGCGIGNHGEEHQRFDRLCEKHGCFVIENVLLSDEILCTITRVGINIKLDTPSTGKCCEVYAICDE